MSEIYQATKPDPIPGHIWHGLVANNPIDLRTRLEVVLPDFDPTLKFENARWQSRDATSLPQRGDTCVVVFDSRGEPWVLGWWPFDA